MSDKNMVKKVDTYRFGPFVFSLKIDRKKIDHYLIEAKTLYSSIRNIPILPNATAQLQDDLIRRSIFGTAKIEGNPLSQEEVDKVLSTKEIEHKLNEPEKQISNLKKAYKSIKRIKRAEKPLLIDEKIIKEIHTIITDGTDVKDNKPGEYMGGEKFVGDKAHGGAYRPPKLLDDIKNLMKALIEWINSPDVLKIDPAIRAGLIHFYLGLIHPFGNGNGRTARAIEAILLRSAGIRYVSVMLSNYYYKNIDEYFLKFSITERNKEHDVTAFIEFVLKGLVLSFKELQKRIFGAIRLLSLRDYYDFLRQKKDISQRQYDLMNILLNLHAGPFTLKDLFDKERLQVIYRGVSERTARRDIEKLLQLSIIKAVEKDKYELSYNVLDFSG